MRAALVLLLIAVTVPGQAARRRAVRHPGPFAMDCTAGGPCPEVVVAGDVPARGFADPSIRRDPLFGNLWMAYSRPHPQSQVIAVDSRLARSDDGGATWRFVQPLWSAEAVIDETGASGSANSETVSLAAGDGRWFSVRLRYFIRAGAAPKLSSFTLRVAAASSPAQLASAEESVLGGALTSSFWSPDVNLAALAPELAGCTWNDPALLHRDGKLYLATQCMLFDSSGEERPEREFVALFSTVPNGNARTWQWRYAGALSNAGDAAELGGLMLQQTDLAVARDGKLLAIVSPAQPSSPLSTHFGCRAVEVASLDPPRLARDAAGRLLVRGVVNVSDQPPYGPGACAYDAASSTGIVIVRRQILPELVVSMHASRVHP